MKRHTFSLPVILGLALIATLFAAPTAHAQVGPPGGTIYANDATYRTVGTPADLPNHGKFDTIYVLGDGLAPVSNAAPGDREYNGGRWEVRLVTFLTIPATQFTNAGQILAAEANGEIQIGDVVRRFECPLIRGR